MIRRDETGLIQLAFPSEVREMDHRTITEMSIPGQVLMELAGAGTCELIVRQAPAGRAVVLCGPGHNGGDGYVIARHLLNRGWDVCCLSTGQQEAMSSDTALNYERFVSLGGEVRTCSEKLTAKMRHVIGHAHVIVDALFGTGLSRPIEGVASELISLSNTKKHAFRVAVDIPSGVDGATGRLHGTAFHADLTATYGIEKVGLHQYPGRMYVGTLHCVSIGLPLAIVSDVGTGARLLDEQAAAARVPLRNPAGHKGSYGHVAICGGFSGKEGAGVLAAMGALHGGAGRVTWLSDGSHEQVERPAEIMVSKAADRSPSDFSVVVIGPGLGQSEPAVRLLTEWLRGAHPVVLDADALNLLAAQKVVLKRATGTVITPHPAEAARLLNTSVDDVQSDRVAAARSLATQYDSVVVLKGAANVVVGPGTLPVLVHAGDPTLSTGGSGDVLAGLIAALVGQGLSEFDAACLGTWVHGRAGVMAGIGKAQRGVTAGAISSRISSVQQQLLLGWRAEEI